MFLSKMSLTAVAALMSIVGFGFMGVKDDVQPIETDSTVTMSADELNSLFDVMEKERAVVAELKTMFEDFQQTNETMKGDVDEIYKALESIQANKVSKEDVESIVDTAIGKLKQQLIESQEQSTAAINATITQKLSESKAEVEDQIFEVKASRPAFVSTQSDECDVKLADHEARIKALEDAITELKAAKLSASAPTGSFGTVSSVKSSGGGSNGGVTYAPVTYYSQPQVMYSPVVSSGGGGCTGSYAQSVSYAPVATAAVANDTKRVRVVEPREPRRVTVVDVPDVESSVAVQSVVPTSNCYTDENGNTYCNTGAAVSSPQVSSSRPGLLGRVLSFGRRR